MDEKELEALQAAMEEFRREGQLSAETLKKLNAAADPAANGLEKITKAGIGVAGKLGNLGKTIQQGEGSFASMGSTIQLTTNLIGKLASALPLVGGAAKALAEGVGDAAKFVLDQLDVMAKNYSALGDSSAIAADGIDGYARQIRQLGLIGMPAFTKAIAQNTTGMAIFGAGMAQGADQFSKLAGALTEGDASNSLLKLGIGFDQIAASSASYVSAFARYGGLQRQTFEQLTKSTQKYIEETDLIARMTGQTRQQQEQEQQKSLADAKFRAKILEMQQNGQEKEAEQLVQYVNGLGGAAGDAARAMVTGIPLTQEAAQANLLSNDAIRQNVEALKSGAKATTAVENTMGGFAQGVAKFGKTIQYTGTDAFGAVAVQAIDFATAKAKADKEGISIQEAAQKIQDDLKNKTGNTTTEFTGAQKAIAGASKDMERLATTLSVAAIPAVNKFADALKGVTGFIDKALGTKLSTTANNNEPPVRGTEGNFAGATKGVRRRGGASAPGSAPSPGATNNRYAGLKLRETGDVTQGGDVDDRLLETAAEIQRMLGGDLKHFSAFNDRYHQKLDRYSAHKEGRALDFTLNDPSKAAQVTSMIKGIIGVTNVKDEYANLSPGGTGGHIHAEIQAAMGGIFKGPSAGYPATLHGTEAVIPLPNGQAVPVDIPGFSDMMGSQAGLLTAQLSKLDELISVMRTQLSTSQRILSQTA